jgi:hypothetical protein
LNKKPLCFSIFLRTIKDNAENWKTKEKKHFILNCIKKSFKKEKEKE